MPPAFSTPAVAPSVWSSDRAAARPWLRAAATVAIAAVLSAGVALRMTRLEQIPGLNGDEAWYGVWALDFLANREVPWRTPTGNPVNVLFLAPQALLHAAAPRSVTLLRSVAVVSGLLAVAVNFLLARRTLGTPGAWMSTLLLAALPINVAYSRFAWDACQTVLTVVAVVHLSLLAAVATRRAGWAWCAVGIAMFAACLVHPTNVFVLPIPLAAAGWRYRGWLTGHLAWKRRTGVLATVAGGLLIGAIIASPGLGRLTYKAAARSVVPEQYALFGRNVARLFSGLSVYRYIAGARLPVEEIQANSLADWHWSDAAAAGVLLALVLAWKRPRTQDDSRDGALAVLTSGGALTLAGFFLIAGPESIEPHYERYGLCLIAPVTLWSAAVLARMVGACPGARVAVWSTVLAICLALEFDFSQNYLRFLETTGGQSHATFRCGEVEPKLAAIRAAVAKASPQRPITLVTGGWWTYWPARYLTAGASGVVVHDFRQPLNWRDERGRFPADAVILELADDAARNETCRRLLAAGVPFEEQSFGDFSGRPAVSLIRPLQPDCADAAAAKQR